MNFKKWSYSLCLILCLWGVARFCHHQTKGFRIAKITHNTSLIPSAHHSLPVTLLNQKFTYFGRGLQSFSFISDDQTTVLKIFNNRYQNRLFWLQFIPAIGPLKKWKEEKVSYNQAKIEKAFASYALAFDRLKKEAGLLAYHPNSCTECPTVTLVDALGIAHPLCLQHHAFVLQKKGELPYPYIDKCLIQNEPQKAKEAIISLVQLMKEKMERGIADNDPLVRANFGFCEGAAMQIDIGPLSFDPTLKEKNRQKEEVVKMTQSFKHWLETHHPELVPTLHEALENF